MISNIDFSFENSNSIEYTKIGLISSNFDIFCKVYFATVSGILAN